MPNWHNLQKLTYNQYPSKTWNTS